LYDLRKQKFQLAEAQINIINLMFKLNINTYHISGYDFVINYFQVAVFSMCFCFI